MTARDLGRSPLETVGLGLALLVGIGVGLLWGIGVVVGSILSSTLPAGGEGVAAILRSFPDVGSAWNPPLSSGLVWAVVLVVVALFAPLVWRVVRFGGLADEGAQWATTTALRHAGLLVTDLPLPRDEPEVADEP